MCQKGEEHNNYRFTEIFFHFAHFLVFSLVIFDLYFLN